ncbi:MAG TPA: hypothetical protein VMU16_01090 [Candidatus Binataceae bacterium]|nr:hypothetical protein [Candidatus Binataceae bacterium]
MAAAMGFFSKLRSPGSSEARLTQEIAELAGQSQGLVERLRRHSALCNLSNIKTKALAIADKEAVHTKALNAILAARDVWSKLPEPPLHDGASNWARLSGDLELYAAIIASLRRMASQWEPIDQAIADQLLVIAAEDDGLESDLRKLALLCDPQALD